ncbi:MAG: NAD(P)/FAD-dependent oxidoreductase [Actinobacteria bacterium]|nr:NAD(P)/FAD-dependent oxidoreductase [Actinomycetota bacterium]MCG2817803.1 NAD(P)/FAD-dependent oxidoreductase [Actinomycetes bacterium]MBU4218515.1 NAD(P)/FAD-dependent oxidoreductase [Actinomycetota bacterium]MBU4359834.1 NAD(P)/FAD-dependent oxidoreductase [Actinomycetota bacterium]MBU4392550.1 NAD(P)/FAD-dependent oxidoreductase [Actinomycetota bacterium]
MKKIRRPDIAVIGAGPAGLAAALAAREAGTRDVMLIERDMELGGILPQCIHDGFGSIVFGEALTGPQYAQRYIDKLSRTDIEVKLNTLVLEISPKRRVTAVNAREGIIDIQPKAIVLAMGCRERTRHQILLPGYRPAGVVNAGLAQRYINIEGLMPGRKMVILGSGDIGLIMARRVTLEGAEVAGVFELMDHPGGLTRNVVQCLNDFDIPLHLSHTVTFIHGKKRVEGVSVAEVDGEFKPKMDTERFVGCDTLLLSVGLIPENEISKKAGVELDPVTGGPVVDERMGTSVPGIFSAGNVVNVFDLVDYVSRTAQDAGRGAAEHVRKPVRRKKPVRVLPGENVKYVVPQLVRDTGGDMSLYFRVERPQRSVATQVLAGGEVISRRKAKMVRPPEMIKADISPGDLGDRGKAGPITVEVVSTEE